MSVIMKTQNRRYFKIFKLRSQEIKMKFNSYRESCLNDKRLLGIQIHYTRIKFSGRNGMEI